MKIKAHELQPGDLLNLEHCEYAPEDPAFEFEYTVVYTIEIVTPECVRVDPENADSFGVPYDYEFEVIREEE